MAGQVLSGMANYCNSMETLSLQGDTSYFSNLWHCMPPGTKLSEFIRNLPAGNIAGTIWEK